MSIAAKRPTATRDDETARQISGLIDDSYRETGVFICSVEGNWHAWVPTYPDDEKQKTSGRELVGTSGLLPFFATVRQAIHERENPS